MDFFWCYFILIRVLLIFQFHLRILSMFFYSSNLPRHPDIVHCCSHYAKSRPLSSDCTNNIYVVCPRDLQPCVHVSTGSWELGWVLCDIWVSLDVLLCTASILSLGAISIDRYLAVTQPLIYSRRRRSKRLALAMILAVWLAAAAITCPPIFGWYLFCLSLLLSICTTLPKVGRWRPKILSEITHLMVMSDFELHRSCNVNFQMGSRTCSSSHAKIILHLFVEWFKEKG